MDEKQFGRQVALLRKEVGYKQDELAERLHISAHLEFVVSLIRKHR